MEVGRVARALEKDVGFKGSIFSPKEIDYCDSKHFPAQHYAARFAAKEAFFKALGTGWRDGRRFKDIEVLGDSLGKPDIILSGKTKEEYDKDGLKNIQLSMSHIKEYALAFVVIEQ